MKAGDYVRTKYGIRKVIQIDNETTSKIRCYVLDKFYNECKICSSNYIYDEHIIKSSPNIIDLIEVGDYVNGWRITTIDKRNNKLYSEYEDGYLIKRIKDKNIERIVTKEQMKAMQYEVK